MATYDDVLTAARQLSPAEREKLVRALGGVGLPTLSAPTGIGPAPHSVAWVKAERGHAVLATDLPEQSAEGAVGADALAGMWADLAARSR